VTILYLSPDEIADHLMLYKLDSTAITEIRKNTLDDLLSLTYTDIGQAIRQCYDMWDIENPYTAGGYDPNSYDTVDSNPKHPHNITREVLAIIWKRVQ
jgi:hypothetical protein